MKKISNLVWGILFIIIGVILGLNALEITNINLFFDGWWTLFIIIPSCIGLVNDKDKVGHIFGIFIGLALLLVCQNVIDFDILWKLTVPIILILIGLSLVFKNQTNENIKKEIKNLTNKESKTKEYCSTFSNMNIKADDEEIEKYELDSIFGELNIDLTEVKMEKDLLINATAIFGSIKLIVPEDIEIKLLSTPIFGDINDKRKKKEKNKKKVVYLNATAIFGGVTIK